MKRLMVVLMMLAAVTPAFAKKDCEELKSEIDAKLKTKGVTNYTLEIVETESGKEGKVVGACDGGTKKIIYNRTK